MFDPTINSSKQLQAYASFDQKKLSGNLREKKVDVLYSGKSTNLQSIPRDKRDLLTRIDQLTTEILKTQRETSCASISTETKQSIAKLVRLVPRMKKGWRSKIANIFKKSHAQLAGKIEEKLRKIQTMPEKIPEATPVSIQKKKAASPSSPPQPSPSKSPSVSSNEINSQNAPQNENQAKSIRERLNAAFEGIKESVSLAYNQIREKVISAYQQLQNMGTTDQQLTESTSSVQNNSSLSVFSNKPVGGINNGAGVQCYANSLSQLLFHTPHLRETLMSGDVGSLPALKKINDALDEQKKTSSSEKGKAVQSLIDQLSELNAPVKRRCKEGKSYKQADPVDFLTAIFEEIDKEKLAGIGVKNIQTIDSPSEGRRRKDPEPDQCVRVMIPESENTLSLTELIDPSMKETTSVQLRNSADKDEWVKKETRSCIGQNGKEPAKTLLFSINRFTYDEYGNEKKFKTKINVNSTISFDESFIQGATKKQSIQYNLNSFIVHQGSSPGGGHYISYVNKGGTWYECDDSSVRAISEGEAKKAAEQGYLFSFSLASQKAG